MLPPPEEKFSATIHNDDDDARAFSLEMDTRHWLQNTPFKSCVCVVFHKNVQWKGNLY